MFIYIIIIYIIYKICKIGNNLTDNKASDAQKVDFFYLKFEIFILIVYKINKYLKSVFTLNAF